MRIKTYILFVILLFQESVTAQTPFYYPGYPVILDSQRATFQKSGIPLIADIDKDNHQEIIFFSVDYNGVASPAGFLYVIRSDGSHFPGFPKGFNEVLLCIASGDVNGDGYLDIAVRLTNSIDVIDRFGNHLPGFPISYNDGDYNPSKPISLYDFDNDGKLELIVSKNNQIAVYNFDGVLRQGWPRYIAGVMRTNPAVGDFDNDGYGEIVAATHKRFTSGVIDSSAIRIFRENGDNFSSDWPVYSDSGYYNWGASPTIILNKNNSDSSLIVMSTKKANDIGGISKNRLIKYNIVGEIVDIGYNSVLNGLGTLVSGDIDDNGTIEYANGNQGNPSSLTVYSNRMIKLSGWPNEGVGEHWATPVIGKLLYNKELNIAANNWYAYDPLGYGFIYAYNQDGSQLPWSPIRPIGLVEAMSLADLNNDGSIEIIATSSKTSNETYLHVWTIPGIPFTHEDFPWPQYGHDRYRSNQHGFIPPDEPVGIQPMNTNVPAAYNLYQNFPNPFNPVTGIKFDIAKKGNVKLVVFDMLGRELSTLINESLNPGTYQVSFDGNNLSSGVYFYKLSTDSFTEIKRMIMAK
ncbi:MAG: T9SS type A sorting domain-containing protein [Ignavibacteria bacterium]|nr:T9SS type A sorting domain-containing protein [Ignavibacteria bacterium]